MGKTKKSPSPTIKYERIVNVVMNFSLLQQAKTVKNVQKKKTIIVNEKFGLLTSLPSLMGLFSLSLLSSSSSSSVVHLFCGLTVSWIMNFSWCNIFMMMAATSSGFCVYKKKAFKASYQNHNKKGN